ncbi:indole-3-glycerol-phosphate synthase [Aureococcus anophagefferens]|nr:indole-3-glycerol-phosphate synthase [Aureococcus anophagefferens]
MQHCTGKTYTPGLADGNIDPGAFTRLGRCAASRGRSSRPPAAPRAVDVARYERQAARFMADAGGGRRSAAGRRRTAADAIDPNWELVKKSLEGLMIKEVWLTLSTIAYYSRLSLSYQLDRFCGSDGQASAYKALIAEGMLPAAAGAHIESIGTDYYYVCLVTGEYWEYTNTLGNRTVYGSANAEAEASDFHAACAAACAAANVGCPTRVVAATRLFDENGTAVGVAGSDVSMDSFSVLLKSWRDVFAPHHVVFIVSGAGGRVDPDGYLVGTSEARPASAVVADAARWFAGRDYEDDRLYVVGGAFVRSIALYFDVYQGPLDWHMVFVQDVACAGFTSRGPGPRREACEWPYLSRSGVDCDIPDRVSAARLEELYRVFRRPLPASGRAEIDRRVAASRPNCGVLELGHIDVDAAEF